MALFTPGSVERVKEASDIVEVISAYTDLKRTGNGYTGLCPFHDERSGSFSVDPTEKLYHCFGCGVGGDVIKFVQEKEGLAFPDAVEALADRYGVELEREAEDPRAEEMRRKRARLSELLERTASFYATFLNDAPQAQRARDYLKERGLGQEALDEFGVGCAPGTWDTILLRGQSAGYATEELEAAGLVLKSQKGKGYYDRFRSRIVFPIRDARGRVQGFGARALLPDQKPKYVNSPEGELYSKRRTLYGIERARAQIVKGESAVVVEGYTDVIACHQAGIRNAVAIMGTAITPEQVKILSAYANEAVLALDADRAGREAMLRAQRVGAAKLRLRVARMPAGKDPADLLAGGDGASANAFRTALEAAEDLPVFHVHTLLDDADLSSPAGRDRALDEVVGVIGGMPDSITREELMREVASRLDADPGLVARRIAGAGKARHVEAARPPADGDGSTTQPASQAPRALNARERRELGLLAMFVKLPVEGAERLAKLDDEHFSNPVAARARKWLEGHLEQPMEGLPREDEALVAYVTQVVMRAERDPASPEAMDLSLLELEVSRLDAELAAAAASAASPPVDLQRRRAELKDRIARAQG
jgi:DNA primase